MRISDWSSDVCSSDLGAALAKADRRAMDDGGVDRGDGVEPQAQPFGRVDTHIVEQDVGGADQLRERRLPLGSLEVDGQHALVAIVVQEQRAARRPDGLGVTRDRSEEHTSDLQSLVTISYVTDW